MSAPRRAGRGRLAAASAGALAGLLIGACACHAGVVVLTNGNVLVGRVSEDADTREVVVRWPYGSQRERGELRLPRERVRWLDREEDVLSDAYFEAHAADPLQGAVWLRMLEEWRIRQERRVEIEPPEVPPPSLDPLALPAVQGPGFRLRKPRGWTAAQEGEILVFQAPTEDGRGFRPRVHAFAVEGVEAAPAAQVEWVQGELARLREATAGRATVELRGRVELGPQQARFLSETRFDGRQVLAERRLVFRGQRTFVLCAYADSRDFAAHQGLFEACLDSLEPDPAP